MSLALLTALFEGPVAEAPPNAYDVPADETAMTTRPWRSDPRYFTKAAVSTLALFKMAKHANDGGHIEVMGLLVGKVHQNTIVVTDVYAIPVEGTETRVNAQLEGYEFMVLYLQLNRALKPDENIVGWYHSHPGYGCWLSGIDVSTQSLNQIQDPYLAIVVDPFKSLKQGKIEIGAFRTYPEGHQSGHPEPEERRAKYGTHSDRYYSLDIEIYRTNVDDQLLKYIRQETWINDLTINNDVHENNESVQIKAINKTRRHLAALAGLRVETSSKLFSHEANNSALHKLLSRRLDNVQEAPQGPQGPQGPLQAEEEAPRPVSGESHYEDDTSNDESSTATRKVKKTASRHTHELQAVAARVSRHELNQMLQRDVERRLFL